jgi:glyoxylase-like metal-dependent hydrolase (beta-lactamase superfamily II)
MQRFALYLAISSLFLAACGSAPKNDTHTTGRAGSLEVFTSGDAGFNTHSFWWDTGSEVVVFDAQFTPELAQALIAEIQAKTSNPITFVVVTHPNPDKFNGAAAFQAIGARVVASAATAQAIAGVHAYKKYFFVNVAKMFTETTYPAEATIDQTFTGDLNLPLKNGAVVELHELQHRGVSSTQTVAEVPALNALVVGDLVHHEAHAWLEGGIVNGQATPDLPSWHAALDEIEQWSDLTVYGGRGGSAEVGVAVAQQKAYLNQVDALVTAYIARLGTRQAELSGPEASVHYAAIQAEAVAAFRGYAHPELIGYGVYGLVNQKVANNPQ